MKQKLLLFAFTIIGTMLFSQSQNTAFEESKSNDGMQSFIYKTTVKTDASGNIYTLGATTTTNGTTDILLTKKNSSNVTLWTKQINGTANYHDFGSGITITSGGDVYITGAITNNTTTLAPELIIRKYNSSGTQQFSTTYSGAGYGAVGKDIIIDGSSNTYIAGAEYNSSLVADMLIISFNSSGTQRWVTNYDYNGLNDGAVKLATKGSNVSITGAITVSSNNYKIATLSCPASTGVLSETITLGSTMTSSVEIVTDMVTDASGNTYLCGTTEVSGQGYNYYLAKLTSSLTIAWEQTYNSSSNMNDVAKGVKVDGSGNVYVTGYSESSTQGKDIRTIKYNSSGTLQWNVVENSSTNGNDEAFDMEMDASSNIYVCGSFANDNGNNLDYYTVKYNSSGTKIWEIKSDGHHLDDQATAMALDSLNNVIVTGQSETAPSTYEYSTVKYIQKDVTTPTDYSLEIPSPNFLFYPNKGQLKKTNDSLSPEVKFYTHHTGPSHLIKKNSSSFVFSKVDAVTATTDTIQRIDMTYDRGLTTKTYPMEEQKDGAINYFLAYTGSTGITGVFGNNRLITPEIYANIDLMYTSNDAGIKYYYIVKPGGNLADIAITFTGATSYSLNGTTNALSLNTKLGSITFAKPIAYQLSSANATVAVTSFSPTWTTNGASNKYKFNTGSYTSSLTLVIEVEQGPSPAKVLHLGGPEWSTPFGSGGYDEAFDIKTDASGNSYWIGTTNDIIPYNPASPGLFTSPVSVNFEVFVTKFGTAWASSANANGYITSGDQLKWTTYWGGTDEDKGYAIAVNGNTASGDIYLTGYTKSSDFPVFTKTGYYNDAYSGNTDAFVINLKYLSGGLMPISNTWATYLGGAGDDIGKDIKINGSDIFVGGSTTSAATTCGCAVPNGSGDNGFPVYSSTFHSTQSGGTDGFLVNLNTTSGLTKATYIGGSSDDIVNEISLSGSDVYFVGSTNSTHTTFSPVTLTGTGVYNQGVIGGGYDAFFGRISSSGNWLSYYGGSGDDNGNSIKLTTNNKFVIAGLTKSSTASSCSTCVCKVPPTVGQFPVCPKSGSTTYTSFNGGASDGFLAEFDINGSYTWGTYIGGDGDDYISSLTFGADNSNNYLFFTGETNTMTKSTLFYDSGLTSVYSISFNSTPVAYSTSSDGYYGAYKDNTLLHSDYAIGNYVGSYFGPTITDSKTNYNKIHMSGAHYYFAGKTTNPNHLRQTGNGSDFSGAMGAYTNAQSWPFNANIALNSTGLVNYDPDAAMMRFNLHGMPMVGINELHKPENSSSLLLFPNPATNMLTIFSKFESTDNVTIEVINLLGQTVYIENLGNKTEISHVINIGHLSDGVYNVTVKGSKFQVSKLFIKQ